MVKLIVYLPCILQEDEFFDPIKALLDSAFVWWKDEKGHEHWDSIYFGNRPLTKQDINHIIKVYGNKHLYYPSSKFEFKGEIPIKNILQNYFDFKSIKEVEIL